MESKKRRRSYIKKEAILKVSEGVLETTVDLAIFFSLWGINFLEIFVSPKGRGGPRSGGGDWIFDAMEQINYQSLKRAIYNARQKGWIAPAKKGESVLPVVTKAGKRRVEARLPFYDEERVWDKTLHLVTYDVPEKKRYDREALRDKLLSLGCGMLQESVYITPYNPQEVLRDFITERELKGAVIVSSVGKDGSIGEEDILDLVYRVYKLEKLNERYKDYLSDFAIKGKGKKEGEPLGAIFSYLSILRDDPQLPFELLPKDWLGGKAYRLNQLHIQRLKKQHKK